MSYVYTLLAFLFGFVCVFMTLLILIQKGRGGGLSGAFGGAGGNTAFGSKTGDVLTWVTSVVFFVFLLLSIVLTWTGDAVYAEGVRVAGVDAASADDEADNLADDGDGADVDGDGLGTGGTGPLGNVQDPDDESLDAEIPGDQ